MPMSFPDMKSLENAARVHKFRDPFENESEPDFRAALAEHVNARDRVEAHEIRTGKGWDQWGLEDKLALFRQ